MDNNFLTIVLVLIGLAVVWAVLRTVLKLTSRMFSLGCIVIVILIGGIWLLSKI
jgi:hypothetical protein